MVSSFHTFASSVPAPSVPGGKIRRGYYPRSQLTQALKAVVTGRMSVREAAEYYKIPKPTLQKRYAKVRDEHIRAEQMVSQMNIGEEYEDVPENASTSGGAYSMNEQQLSSQTGVAADNNEAGCSSRFQHDLSINYADHNYVENFSGNIRQCLTENKTVLQRRPIHTRIVQEELISSNSDDHSGESNNVSVLPSEQFYQEVADINSRLPASSQLPRHVDTILVKDISGILLRKIILQHSQDLPISHDSEGHFHPAL